MSNDNSTNIDDSAKKDSVEKSTLVNQTPFEQSRRMTAEQARELSRRAIEAFKDPNNRKVYEIDDTGPNGSLRGWIPRP